MPVGQNRAVLCVLQFQPGLGHSGFQQAPCTLRFQYFSTTGLCLVFLEGLWSLLVQDLRRQLNAISSKKQARHLCPASIDLPCGGFFHPLQGLETI